MPRCTLPGHTEFKHSRCVKCHRRRSREYMAECRAARRKLRELEELLSA